MQITVREMNLITEALKAQATRIKNTAMNNACVIYPTEKDLQKCKELWQKNLAINSAYKELIALYEKFSGERIEIEVE